MPTPARRIGHDADLLARDRVAVVRSRASRPRRLESQVPVASYVSSPRSRDEPPEVARLRRAVAQQRHLVLRRAGARPRARSPGHGQAPLGSRVAAEAGVQGRRSSSASTRAEQGAGGPRRRERAGDRLRRPRGSPPRRAAHGRRRRADAHAGRDRGRARVEGHGVAVDGDRDPARRSSASLPSTRSARRLSSTRWLSVPPETSPWPRRAASRPGRGVRHDLRAGSRGSLGAGDAKQTAFAAMVCISGPPCMPGKTAESIFLRELGAAQDEARARAGERLVGGRRDDVGVGTGLGCTPAATRPAMWAMSTMNRASTSSAIARNAAKSTSRIRRGARRRPASAGAPSPASRTWSRSMSSRLGRRRRTRPCSAAREVDLVPVRQVAALVEPQREHRVAEVEHGDIAAMLAGAPACGCTLACSAPKSSFARSIATSRSRRRPRSRRSSAGPGSPRRTCS